MSLVYSLLAALAAVSCEVFYKSHPHTSYLGTAILGVPLALLVNYGIWGTLHSGESVLGLAVVFSLSTAALRVVWTLSRGGPVSGATWAAFGLVVLASLVKVVWR